MIEVTAPPPALAYPGTPEAAHPVVGRGGRHGSTAAMSDLEKVYAYACELGSGTPIRLRWEGAGDCAHPVHLLGGLKHKTYPGTQIRIKYAAVINIYEPETDPIFVKAKQQLQLIHVWGSAAGQGYVMKANADITRDPQALGQEKAHIMFVRNLMPTNGNGASLTKASESLQTLHKEGLRQRSKSLVGGGQIRLGMSGAPGLVGASEGDRLAMKVDALFTGANDLIEVAEKAGLKMAFTTENIGKDDYDRDVVMKNNGASLGDKNTYYMTFMLPG